MGPQFKLKNPRLLKNNKEIWKRDWRRLLTSFCFSYKLFAFLTTNCPKMSKISLVQITQFLKKPKHKRDRKKEICHVQWDTINHVSFWHDDPINFKIVWRQCFTQKCWKLEKLRTQWLVIKTNLIFHRVFERPFWAKIADCHLKYTKNLLACFEFSWTQRNRN